MIGHGLVEGLGRLHFLSIFPLGTSCLPGGGFSLKAADFDFPCYDSSLGSHTTNVTHHSSKAGAGVPHDSCEFHVWFVYTYHIWALGLTERVFGMRTRGCFGSGIVFGLNLYNCSLGVVFSVTSILLQSGLFSHNYSNSLWVEVYLEACTSVGRGFGSGEGLT